MSYIKIIGAEAPANTLGPQTFNPNTGINANSFIAIASQRVVNNQPVTYFVAAGNTIPTGLSISQTYYAVYANATGLALSLTSGGANITISNSGKSETGHTLLATHATGASTMRVYNSSGAVNTFSITNNTGVAYANLTLAVGEVLYVAKSSTDTVWSTANMMVVPISYRGA